MEDKLKVTFAAVVIACVTGLQCVAWATGRNGQVFAFTSLLIGAVAGAVLGFSISAKTGK